jgi:hypothetical protein
MMMGRSSLNVSAIVAALYAIYQFESAAFGTG